MKFSFSVFENRHNFLLIQQVNDFETFDIDVFQHSLKICIYCFNINFINFENQFDTI